VSEYARTHCHSTSFGALHHYTVHLDDKRRFRIECGSDQVPMFSSLHELVEVCARMCARTRAMLQYYTKYAYIMPNTGVELLPWWALDRNEYVPPHHRKCIARSPCDLPISRVPNIRSPFCH
jgi:O-glycosyl hydrolase